MATVCIPEHVRSVIDEHGAVVLDVQRGTYFALNEVGVEIWRQLETGAPLAEVAALLVRTYNTAPETVEQDLAAFIQQLRAAHLIAVDGA
jgi:hypothetical protein